MNNIQLEVQKNGLHGYLYSITFGSPLITEWSRMHVFRLHTETSNKNLYICRMNNIQLEVQKNGLHGYLYSITFGSPLITEWSRIHVFRLHTETSNKNLYICRTNNIQLEVRKNGLHEYRYSITFGSPLTTEWSRIHVFRLHTETSNKNLYICRMNNIQLEVQKNGLHGYLYSITFGSPLITEWSRKIQTK